MRGHGIRLAAVAGSAVLVVLTGRTIAYALTPGIAARVLEHRAGGPSLPVIAMVALALAASAAIIVCWLASLAVRERALLEGRAAPRFRLGRMLALTLVLALVTTVAGGLFEAYIHWRDGLGWHGLDCIAGPVHRNLVPIDCALSLVAAALLAAAEHVGRWMGRTIAALREIPPRLQVRSCGAPPPRSEVRRFSLRIASGGPRAPPAFA